MSEQATEQTTPQTQQQPQATTQDTTSSSSEQTYPIRLVKRQTGDVHWNTAKGIWETITHAETGEPNSEYALLATIDGVDVPLSTFNAGGIETIVRSQQQAQQQNAG